MLVLTREKDEIIMIGDDIEIMVVEFKGTGTGKTRVRLGIRAPASVSVHRREIWEAIQRDKSRAGKGCQCGGPAELWCADCGRASCNACGTDWATSQTGKGKTLKVCPECPATIQLDEDSDISLDNQR